MRVTKRLRTGIASTIPPTVLEWSRGLAIPSPGVVLCRGLHDAEWRETPRRFQELVERWGMRAHAAGWDTLRPFGVGSGTRTLRGDFCGILIPCSVDVHKVTPEWIKLGRWTADRREPVKMPGMIPIREAKQ